MSGCLGLSVLLAVVHDFLFLASFHIFIIYSVFSAFYKFILQMTGTLFRVFKGKKYNVLRMRDDSNNFQIQELYLGVLLVTLIIFLTPTIAMYYYMCFIFLIVSILIDQILLLNLQNIASNLPMFLLMKSIFAPFSLPNSYTLRIEGNAVYKIVPNKCDKASVFSHLTAEFKLILKEASVGKIIGMILKGENLFYLMKNLLNITTRLIN